MKKLLLSTALLGASALAVSAQDATTGTTTDAATGTATADTMAVETFRAAPDAMEIRGTDLMGMRIYSSAAAVDATEYDGLQDGWEDIGEVGDVILSRDGQVEAVLVDVGGFLGIGEREVAVSMDALRFVADNATADNLADYFIVVNTSREALEAAPEYVMGDAASGMTADDAAMATDGAMAADGTAMATDEAMAAEDGAMMAAEDTAMATEADPLDTEEPAATDDAMATTDAPREPTSREGFALADAGTLTSDRLTGATVYDVNDERIGSVDQLVLTADGMVQDVVIDVGGFLGIGQKPVALPMGEIDILQAVDGDELRVYLPQTREALEAMPDFEG